jgi:hypothetical protein
VKISRGAKTTFQSESDQDAIDRPETIGGKGISSLSTGIGMTKPYAVTHDQSHCNQGAAIVVLRKIKCHHNLASPTVLLFEPGWSARDKSFRKCKSSG